MTLQSTSNSECVNNFKWNGATSIKCKMSSPSKRAELQDCLKHVQNVVHLCATLWNLASNRYSVRCSLIPEEDSCFQLKHSGSHYYCQFICRRWVVIILKHATQPLNRSTSLGTKVYMSVFSQGGKVRVGPFENETERTNFFFFFNSVRGKILTRHLCAFWRVVWVYSDELFVLNLKSGTLLCRVSSLICDAFLLAFGLLLDQPLFALDDDCSSAQLRGKMHQPPWHQDVEDTKQQCNASKIWKHWLNKQKTNENSPVLPDRHNCSFPNIFVHRPDSWKPVQSATLAGPPDLSHSHCNPFCRVVSAKQTRISLKIPTHRKAQMSVSWFAHVCRWRLIQLTNLGHLFVMEF